MNHLYDSASHLPRISYSKLIAKQMILLGSCISAKNLLPQNIYSYTDGWTQNNYIHLSIHLGGVL